MLRPFYPALALAATVFFTGPSAAEMRLDPNCMFDAGSPQSCTHVVACIGGNTLFVGGSVGWDSGFLYGTLHDGSICEGVWDNATASADFACSDGTEGTVRYLRRDDPTGTAIGRGTTLDGRAVEAWSGDNIAGYVQRETGRVTLQCGVRNLPMM